MSTIIKNIKNPILSFDDFLSSSPKLINFLLKQNTIEVLITEKLEKNTNLHRKTLSQNTYNQISSNYIPIM